jgi:hypothetical protein
VDEGVAEQGLHGLRTLEACRRGDRPILLARTRARGSRALSDAIESLRHPPRVHPQTIAPVEVCDLPVAKALVEGDRGAVCDGGLELHPPHARGTKPAFELDQELRPNPCRLAEAATSSVMTCPSVPLGRQPSTKPTARPSRSATMASAVF